MKQTRKINGFAVEILPAFRSGRTIWTAWFGDLPTVRAHGSGYDDAVSKLSARWAEVKAAYRASGQPIPTPVRRRGNKRILDAINRLGKRVSTPIF
ncbi:MAG TPA: hypothetical protein VF472_12525 [Burkholderiaceae bacterium]